MNEKLKKKLKTESEELKGTGSDRTQIAVHHEKLLEKTPWYRILIGYGIFFGLALLFTKLAEEVMEKETLPFDTMVLEKIHQFAGPALDQMFLFITSLAGAAVIASIALLLSVIYYLRHEIYNSIYIMLSLGGTFLLNIGLKYFFRRSRPDLWTLLVVEKDYSFPSGHSMISMALALVFIVLAWHTRARWAAIVTGIVYVGAVGLSRLYLGVHYPTDVAGGWLMSMVWIYLVTRFMLRYTAFRENAVQSV